MTPDPYRTLGVPKAASQDDIKSAYRRLAREHHPDRKPGDKRAENQFKDISNAYALLSDVAKRRKFDAGEIDADGNPRPGFAKGPNGPRGYDAYKRAGGGFGFGFGGGKAGDKTSGEKKSRFNQFFRDKGSVKAKGADVTYSLKVSLSEAAQGANKTVRMTSGKSLRVHIPPGTTDGQVLRLKNQGMDGLGGGRAGDALVEILVIADGRFKSDGLDVHSEEAVTLDEALLGARIEVQTLHGPLRITVPEGSNTGTKLRLKGKGVHSAASDASGDHYVTLKVVLPKGNNAELKKLVKKWAAKNPYAVRAETLKKDAAE